MEKKCFLSGLVASECIGQGGPGLLLILILANSGKSSVTENSTTWKFLWKDTENHLLQILLIRCLLNFSYKNCHWNEWDNPSNMAILIHFIKLFDIYRSKLLPVLLTRPPYRNDLQTETLLKLTELSKIFQFGLMWNSLKWIFSFYLIYSYWC